MKLTIDISNYEIYAMDYIEGNLDAETQAAFLAFLALHPEIAEELDEIGELEPLAADPSVHFEERGNLIKEIKTTALINEENYEQFFSLSVDEELTSSESEALSEFVALNPSLQPELNLYKKAVLQSDEHVVYPEKSSLKRSIPLWSTEHTAFKTAYRAAAAVVVLFSAYTVLQVIQNDTIYTPRTDGFTWENTSTIDEGSPLNNNATTGSTPSSTNTTTSLLAQATPTTKRAEVTKIPVLTGGLTNSPSASMPVESREMVAYPPRIRRCRERQ